MTLRTSPWPAGVPCWADLVTPDVRAASAFYSAVLGWSCSEPDEAYGGYAVASTDSADAAGIGPLPGPDVRSAWTLYLASDDADAIAAAVSQHGGRVLLAPGDVGDRGRMLLAADPTGAPFGVWQAGSTIGAEVVDQPGGLCWEDLRSPDPDAARDFYAALFGYQYEGLDMAGPDYTMFRLPQEQAPLGGVGPMMGAQGPAHWLVYFGVADTHRAVAAAERSGGGVVAPAVQTPYGVMAGLADPAGAVFWVVQNTGQPQPDRAG